MTDASRLPESIENVEEFFDEFVRLNGGVRASDEVGKAPNFRNADYILHDRKIIMELKELQKNFIEDEDFVTAAKKIKIDRHMKDWEGKSIESQEEFDNVILTEIKSTMRKKLAQILKKANTQIKDLKKQGITQDYNGVVIIVNERFDRYPHEYIFSVLCSVLSQQYSSIRVLVYCTINLWTAANDGTDNLIWLTAYSDKAEDALAGQVDDLGRAMFNLLNSKGIVDEELYREIERLEDMTDMINPRSFRREDS
ncbi:hypothetical protein [Deinococcus sp. AJ005]|uniref:hypothetical protein n=1 Tax=Deinococcus sp. AJ005 TaxID=2652443 RepID=UPI00125CB950|nr:hypothetical protein [Deinococcus sp. AJ005]QFP77120.1 hypothetical protein DAAJ005_12170 [Deinococcus sp. AJ005]